MKKAHSLLFLGILTAALMAGPVPAKAGIIEFLFPSLRLKADDPAITLQAPFADPASENTDTVENPDEFNDDFLRLPENATPLEQPHRTKQQIGEWLMTAVPMALTFKNQSFEEQQEAISIYFNDAGLAQLKTFLKDSQIERVAKSGQFDIAAYSERPPLAINDSELNGYYRWLFDVPVVVSFLEKGIEEYKGKEATNRNYTLSVQVRRTRDTDNPDGVVIEIWNDKRKQRQNN